MTIVRQNSSYTLIGRIQRTSTPAMNPVIWHNDSLEIGISCEKVIVFPSHEAAFSPHHRHYSPVPRWVRCFAPRHLLVGTARSHCRAGIRSSASRFACHFFVIILFLRVSRHALFGFLFFLYSVCFFLFFCFFLGQLGCPFHFSGPRRKLGSPVR